MSNTTRLVLSIVWMIVSLLWFWAENTVLGVIWLCAGTIGLIVSLARRRKE